MDASTHAVLVEPCGWVVLKRSWSTDARALEGEAARLDVARAAAVPTPLPIAVDSIGQWFDRPALVMSLLAGRSVFHAAPGDWLAELAGALAIVHATPLPVRLPAVLGAPHAGVAWRPAPPEKLRPTARVRALQQVAVDLQAKLRNQRERPVLVHHDFHHGNVLWRSGRLSGVLDWNEATAGPAVCDVAYCSVDLALTYGARAANQFTRAYRAVSIDQLDDLPGWQALWTANAMRWAPFWLLGFRDAGITHLDLRLVRRRLQRFADQILRAT